jgi:serine protease inhibitor
MESNSSFQVSLFKKLNGDKNIFISPTSIYQALALTANGAVGETQKSMLDILEPSSPKIETCNKLTEQSLKAMDVEKGIKYTIANAVLTKVQPSEGFNKIAETIYHAKVDKLEDVAQVNKWCSEKTNGKIEKILDKLDNNIRMIILNAIYFSAQWSEKFDDCGDMNFNLKNNSAVTAPFIKKQLQDLVYSATSSEQLIGIKFKQSQFHFYIILPNVNIDDYVASFTDDKLDTLLSQSNKENIDLTIPKFKIEYGSSLKDALIGLSMKLPFTTDADFSGITSESALMIDDVIHKTFLKVDENGLEAAAVTAVMMNRCMIPHVVDYKEVIVDRPFFVAIKHPESKNCLFLGKIENVTD